MEISRLLDMNVIRDPEGDELANATILSTRSVFDWRFRGGKWVRHCRYVAREFKAGAKGDSTTFAPTSGIGGRLVLMMHVCFGWSASFLDIKDAFLLVDQQELVAV